jgi:hypothetical protein
VDYAAPFGKHRFCYIPLVEPEHFVVLISPLAELDLAAAIDNGHTLPAD